MACNTDSMLMFSAIVFLKVFSTDSSKSSLCSSWVFFYGNSENYDKSLDNTTWRACSKEDTWGIGLL